MELKQKLNTIIDKWNLLNHPFYQAWSAGTLTKTKLQEYASEYGAFIALLPEGWATLHDVETMDEEAEHYDLWKTFTQSIGAQIQPAKLQETQDLCNTAHNLFSQPATAIGALYAFEVQQPLTAQSKLKGLQEQYTELNAHEKYFEEHSHNEHESEKVLTLMDKLEPKEQEKALIACEQMAQALWNGLSGIQSAGK